MNVPCVRCGKPVSVPEGLEIPDDVLSRGAGPLTFAHQVCPDDEKPQYRYEARLTLMRIEADGETVQLASVASSTEAPTFPQALERLSPELNERWDRLVQMAALAEQDLDNA